MTQTVPLGEVLMSASPGFASGDDLEVGIFQIRMNNISRGGELILDQRRRVSAQHKKVSTSLLEPGDVLFNATYSPDLVGKTAFFSGCDEPAVFSNHFIRLRTDRNRLDPQFLTRWLQREFARGLFKGRAKQWVNQATFSKDLLVELPIPLPSIEQQRRIAAVLDAADVLRVKRRQALAKLDTLTQAIFFDMFGDPRQADLESLAQHVGLITKGTTPTSVGFQFTASGVPFVRVQDLVAGTVAIEGIELFISAETSVALRRSILKPLDVLVSIAGTIGRIAVVPETAPELNCNQAVALIRTAEGLDPLYLAAWMNTTHAHEQLLGSRVTGTISNLSLRNIRNLQLPVPPAHEQSRFVERIRGGHKIGERLASSSATLDSLFFAIQQRAFRGEL